MLRKWCPYLVDPWFELLKYGFRNCFDGRTNTFDGSEMEVRMLDVYGGC